VWVSDLTYLDTREGPAYLSLITDKVARKIQGYHVSEDLKTTGCLKALQMAQEKLPAGQHPIHHSDRGCQYASRAYAEALASRQMPSSMTEKNHCAENALAERMNGILKQEYGLDERFATMSQAREAVEQAIYLYNEKRPHTALDYQTPSAKHQASQAEAGNSWRPAPFRLASLASTAPAAMN
jgi:transposase InsO family protein